MRHGMNLEWADYPQSDQKFIDLMLVSGGNANFPGDNTGKNWIPAKEGYCRPGDYVLTAEGKGTLHLYDDDVPQDKQTCVFTGAGERYVFTFRSPRKRAMLAIAAQDKTDRFRNVRLRPVELEGATGVCHPTFLETLKGMHTLRSLHFYNVEASQEVNWKDARPNIWTLFFQTCNEANCHPWINLPHMASADYCTQLGTLAAGVLSPRAVPRIEYSNEVWNWGYPWAVQSSWVNNNKNYPGTTMRQRYAIIGSASMDAFAAGFGRPILRTCMGQFADPSLLIDSMDYAVKHGLHYDMIGAAPYVDTQVNWPVITAVWDAGLKDQAVTMFISTMTAKMTSWYENQCKLWSSLADKYGTALGAYEWGPGTQVGKTDTKRGEIMAYIHRSQAMGDHVAAIGSMMSRYFDEAIYYSHCRPWGSGEFWALREFLDDSTPKAVAVAKMARRSDL